MKKEKTRIVNYLKLGIFLFGMSLLLWSCEKEDITSETPELLSQKKSPKIQTLNLKKAKKIPDFLEISDAFKISYLFDKEIEKNDLKSKSKQKDDFTIDFNNFKRIENKDLVTYTFLIKRNSVKEEHLTENLIIEKRNGKVRGYIMKYKEASYYEKDNHKHLKAKISKTPHKENLEGVLKIINGNLLARMSCEYEMLATARNCSVHGMFSTDSQCINAQNNNYWDYSMVLVCTDSGSGGDRGFTDFGYPADGSIGGGGSSSGGGSTSPIIPCEDVIHGCDKMPHLKLANELGIIDQAQIDYLENNSILVGEINIFLDDTNNATEAKNFANEIIASGTDGTLVSTLPFVKYPVGSNYANLYPKLTEYLKNQLPKIGDNAFIVSVIKKYTSLSEEEIKKQLKWGNGPTIKIEQLGDDPIIGEPYHAEFRKNSDSKSIYLDLDLVNQSENSATGSKLAEAFLFYIGVCILHEFVHYGDYNYNGDAWNFPQEEGVLFERDVYGYRVYIEDGKIRLIKK